MRVAAAVPAPSAADAADAIHKLEHPELLVPNDPNPAFAYLGSMLQLRRLHSPVSFATAALVVYAPVGVALLLLRLLLLLLVAVLLPPVLTEDQLSWALVIVSAPMGILVTLVDPDGHWDAADPPGVVVANHLSEMDGIALKVLGPLDTLGYDFFKNSFFFQLLRNKIGFIYVPHVSRTQGGAAGRDALRQLLVEKVRLRQRPILCFPEGGMTNGRVGLLQYHTFMFSLGTRVQPIALTASDGVFPVHINDETSTCVANILWFLFLPWHRFTVRVLPPTTIGDGETPLAFAQRVMLATANALRIAPTPFLYKHKMRYLQWYRSQRARRPVGVSDKIDPSHTKP
ncbi:hypothetical protein ACHHYP_00987 [Achlya hypogyna]|uniref:Phospholipid/glycerol acyltransferase domain-containing protein n=1 Tax=Achlya hypogyna TaxID=1202772 RepID=A0A1V9Z9K1_ACHHY|nr:hypothetical protein ACHHYP_00987 [Achlya hypogyna]